MFQIVVNWMMRKRKTDTTYDYYKEIEKDIKGDQFSPSSCDERLKQTKTNITTYLTEGLLFKEKLYTPADLNKYYMKILSGISN